MTLGRLFIKQCYREWLLQVRQIRLLINSCLFFLMIVFMFPMTMQPDAQLMRDLAPGIVWIALLLFALLSSERIYQQDYDHGVIEQWLISGQSLSIVVGAKVLAHWFFHILPIMVLTPVVGLLYSLTAWELQVLIIAMFCASPALYFLCALAAAFGIGMNQKSALMGLIILPLTLPLLIFASGVVRIAMQGLPINGYLALLVAMSILCVSFLPSVIAAVIRILCSEGW